MRGLAARLNLQIVEFTAAGILILAGASFNIQGHTGRTGLLVMVGGLLAVSAGILHARWRYAVILGLLALIALVGGVGLEQLRNGALSAVAINVLGLLALVLGGFLGSGAYRRGLEDRERRLEELESLNEQLEQQHRIFLAATEEPTFLGTDAEARARSAAEALEASFCAYYLSSPDGRQLAPEGAGWGFTHVRPGPVARGTRGDGLLGAIERGEEFYTEERRDLSVLFRFFPPDFRILNALCVPIRVGERIEGFIVVGDKEGGFSEDDRRLVRTLASRAGIAFASVNAIELSQKEAGRYALLNELVREASGLTVEEAMDLVLARGRELIDYEAGRVAVFAGDGTYHMAGGSQVPAPIAGSPLQSVHREGRTVLRRATAADGLFSGLQLGEGAAASEALVAIRGKGELFGALCLGRRGTVGFTDEDIATLEELGTIAGLAVENSRIVASYAGQATRLDSALDVLGEVSRALTTTTEGRRTLEQEALKAAVRITGCDHALLTRVSSDGQSQRVSTLLGFPTEVGGLKIENGQGLIGAVMLSGAPVALADASESFEMSSPPDLAALGLRGAVCVPMLAEGQLQGTISVFAPGKRDWSEEDVRSLSTLANATFVALKNAQMFEQSRKHVWELTNLHEGLKAVTSTLQLDEVMRLVLGWAARASEAQIGCIALEEEGRLRLVGAYGSDDETASRLALGLGGEICLDVMASGQAFMEHMEKPGGAAGTPLEPRAVLCVPLTLREKPIGVVFLANYVAGRSFNDDHRRLVTALASQAAVAIDNARLFKDREDVFLSALNSMAATVDARDPYTAGHSQRVTEYALAIARHMDYAPGDEGAWSRLRQGTLLHDIGKLGVPDDVLRKPGRLTAEEFAQMRRHPLIGYEILKELKLLTDELIIVRSHHERYDGKGYPDGKRGDQLPMYAWIVSAADALDAMTSDRPYRKALDLSVALAEIEKGKGSHFHPLVAEAVVEAVREGALKVITSQSLYTDAPVVGAFENPVA